jgi:hypothetical protein
MRSRWIHAQSAAACGLTAVSYKSSSPKSGSTGRSTTAINAIESGRRSGVRKRRRKVFSLFDEIFD